MALVDQLASEVSNLRGVDLDYMRDPVLSAVGSLQRLEAQWAAVEETLEFDDEPRERVIRLSALLDALDAKLVRVACNVMTLVLGVCSVWSMVQSDQDPLSTEQMEEALRKAVEPLVQQRTQLSRTRARIEATGKVSVYLVTGPVRLRTGPGTAHDEIDLLPANTRVYITDEVDGWFGGVAVIGESTKAGWIDARYLIRDAGHVE